MEVNSIPNQHVLAIPVSSGQSDKYPLKSDQHNSYVYHQFVVIYPYITYSISVNGDSQCLNSCTLIRVPNSSHQQLLKFASCCALIKHRPHHTISNQTVWSRHLILIQILATCVDCVKSYVWITTSASYPAHISLPSSKCLGDKHNSQSRLWWNTGTLDTICASASWITF